MEEEKVCFWSKEDEDNGAYYETDCGNAFQFNNDDWQANHFIYCPYCGKLIKDKPIEE